MIQSVRLQKFRSYTDESFEFAPGVNIIVGPNASGKTNLLEALLVASQGKSFRARDSDLVQFKKSWARVEAHTSDQTRVVKLEQQLTARTHKSFTIDGQVFSRLSLAKSLPLVVFEPNDLQLLTSAPEQRRAFLDNLIEQTVSGYDTIIRQYRRALSQRNALLKKGHATNEQLFAWNVRLSELGGQIAAQRHRLIDHFNKRLGRLYSQLAKTKTKVLVEYLSACNAENYSSDLLKQLERSVELDTLRGFTSHGPHRDDLAVKLGGHSLQAAASRGEARTMLLALKLVELQLVEDLRGKPPILLLDDVFSELDGARRHALTDFLGAYQNFITTTDADVVVQHFMGQANIIPTTKKAN